jgi:hypothetical protein
MTPSQTVASRFELRLHRAFHGGRNANSNTSGVLNTHATQRKVRSKGAQSLSMEANVWGERDHKEPRWWLRHCSTTTTAFQTILSYMADSFQLL